MAHLPRPSDLSNQKMRNQENRKSEIQGFPEAVGMMVTLEIALELNVYYKLCLQLAPPCPLY